MVFLEIVYTTTRYGRILAIESFYRDVGGLGWKGTKPPQSNQDGNIYFESPCHVKPLALQKIFG